MKSNYYSAVYTVIKNEKGEVLFGRRKSPFRNGFFQLIAAGHMENGETMKACAIREAKEELGITIEKDDLQIIHISHRVCPDRMYYDVYLEVKKYAGTLQICEPEKCSEIQFFNIDNLPSKEKFVGYDIDVLKKIEQGESFSDIVYE